MVRIFCFALVATGLGLGFSTAAVAHDAHDPDLRGDQTREAGTVRVGEVRDTRDSGEIRVGEVRDMRDSAPPVELGGSNARLWDVELREQVQSDGSVRGVVSNLSNDPVQDIQLLVSHSWMWADEQNPGEMGPGRARYVTLPGLLPPGKSVEFQYEPAPPLDFRSDGRFSTTAEIVGFDRITYKTVPRGTVPDDRSGLQ